VRGALGFRVCGSGVRAAQWANDIDPGDGILGALVLLRHAADAWWTWSLPSDRLGPPTIEAAAGLAVAAAASTPAYHWNKDPIQTGTKRPIVHVPSLEQASYVWRQTGTDVLCCMPDRMDWILFVSVARLRMPMPDCSTRHPDFRSSTRHPDFRRRRGKLRLSSAAR
jgi:hypothetical protein